MDHEARSHHLLSWPAFEGRGKRKGEKRFDQQTVLHELPLIPKQAQDHRESALHIDQSVRRSFPFEHHRHAAWDRPGNID